MAIEVNEFQTQLTDELLDSLDREVREYSIISKKPNNTSNQNHGTYWQSYP